MPQRVSKKSRKPFMIWLLIGLTFPLGIVLYVLWKRKPKQIIHDVLEDFGYSEQTIRYWTCVSAFETAVDGVPWKSQVLHDSRNLFCIIVPGSNKLSYGEHQTIYDTLPQSVHGLIDKVIKPFHYPDNFATLEDLVNTMYKNGYFTGDAGDYQAGVDFMYQKLYG